MKNILIGSMIFLPLHGMQRVIVDTGSEPLKVPSSCAKIISCAKNFSVISRDTEDRFSQGLLRLRDTNRQHYKHVNSLVSKYLKMQKRTVSKDSENLKQNLEIQFLKILSDSFALQQQHFENLVEGQKDDAFYTKMGIGITAFGTVTALVLGIINLTM